ITLLVIEQVFQKTRISQRNPRFLLFFNGSCLKTEVFKQLYLKKSSYRGCLGNFSPNSRLFSVCSKKNMNHK
ncbi:MAG: hypothetical protein LBP69_08055, partial [Treponema sp.]|nr:hypothetical protein [Treponema sp.]